MENRAAFRRKTREKFGRVLITVSSRAPSRPVAVDDDASLSGSGALRGAVHESIDEHEGVTGLEMDFDCAGGLPFVLYPILVVAARDLGMIEIRLVAAGDDHCAAIAGADVGEGEEDIDLAAAEEPVHDAILVADDCVLATGVDGEETARAPDGGEAFVDEKSADVRVAFAAIAEQAIDPCGMIDQLLEGGAGLDNILKLHAGVAVIIKALDIAPPLTDGEILREAVEGGIQVREEGGFDGVFEDRIAVEIEEIISEINVVLHGGRMTENGIFGMEQNPEKI